MLFFTKGMIISGGLARCWLLYIPIPAQDYMEVLETGWLCANPLLARENTKDGGWIQQKPTVFAATNDCFVDNFFTVVD